MLDDINKLHTLTGRFIPRPIRDCFAWHMRGAVQCGSTIVWSAVLKGQNPTQDPACTVIPFHIVSPLLSMQGVKYISCVYG